MMAWRLEQERKKERIWESRKIGIKIRTPKKERIWWSIREDMKIRIPKKERKKFWNLRRGGGKCKTRKEHINKKKTKWKDKYYAI